MKKGISYTLILLFSLLMLLPFLGRSQATYTAPIGYNTGSPTAAPGAQSTRWRFDLLTGRTYKWSPTAASWVVDGYGIDNVSGCVPPAYTPAYAQSIFAANGCDSLYMYRAGHWRHLNPGGGGSNISAGAGITISGTPPDLTINADDVSATNELNTALYVDAGSLVLDDAGGSVSVPLSQFRQGIYSAGTGIGLNLGTGVISNTGDLSTTNELNTSFSVTGGNLRLTDPGGNLDVAVSSIAPVQAVAAGSGISISGTTTLEVTNSAPDQTVVLNDGTGIDVTGTYPNFTVINTAPNIDDSTFAKIDDFYLYKRITDNVYKYGTLGIRTKDTTGVLNIYTPSATKAAVSVINTPIFFQYKRGSMPPWRLQQKSSANTDGTTNNVLELMYNWYGSGNIDVAGDAQFGLSLEPHWITATGDTVAEAHILFYDVFGNAHRPITGFFDYKNKRNRSSWGFATDQVHFDGDLINLQSKITVNKYANGGYRPLEVYGNRYALNPNSSSYTKAQMDSVSRISVGTQNSGVLAPLTGVSSLIRFEVNQDRADAFYLGVVNQNGSNFDSGSDFIGLYNSGGTWKESFRILDATGYFGIRHGGASRPQQPLDVNGASHFRGSVRVNMVGDSSALVLKYASTQTSAIFKVQNNAGTDLFWAHSYNASNPSLVFGKAGSINSTSPNNTVFGLTTTAFTAGKGNNTLVGYNTGGGSYNGYENTHVGSGCGRNTTDGFQNTLVGYLAGWSLMTGYQNMFLGRLAGGSCVDGNTTTAIGSTALQSAVTPTGTVVIGSQAAQNTSTISDAVVIGNLTGRLRTDLSGSVLIGANVANASGTATNQLWIDNTNTSTPLIGGDFTNNRVGINTAPGSIAASSILEITSTTAGVLLPRMTTTQRDAISSPAAGLTLYCTDCAATDSSTGVMQTYNGTTWKNNW